MRSWIKRAILLCALAISAASFAGCGDDDDVPPDGGQAIDSGVDARTADR